MTPWTAAHQAPLSMGFSRQEYWSGFPLPSPSICGGKVNYKILCDKKIEIKILKHNERTNHKEIIERNNHKILMIF